MPTPSKPSVLKVLEGNRGHRKILPEPMPLKKQRTPSPPKNLSPVAKTEWKRLAKELHRLGLLTIVDMTMLETYCIVYARWVDAEEHVRSEGIVVLSPLKKVPMQNPYLSIANRAMEQMLKLSHEFGFTPASRTKIHVGNTKKDEPTQTMDAFLARGKRARQAGRKK